VRQRKVQRENMERCTCNWRNAWAKYADHTLKKWR